jgi:hypothetical protein
MEESGTGKTEIPISISVQGMSIDNYEDARAFFMRIENGSLQKAFTRLFSIPSDFDLPNLTKYYTRRDLIYQFKKKYGVHDIGAWICVALLLETDPTATSIPMSRVRFLFHRSANYIVLFDRV